MDRVKKLMELIHRAGSSESVVILKKDEELFPTLYTAFQKLKWESAWLIGLGALKEVELGFYHLHKKEYDRRRFEDDLELISLSGNLSLKDGSPFLHLHTSLGQPDFSVVGGHLFEAVCAVTVEIRAFRGEMKLVREFSKNVGLAVIGACPG